MALLHWFVIPMILVFPPAHFSWHTRCQGKAKNGRDFPGKGILYPFWKKFPRFVRVRGGGCCVAFAGKNSSVWPQFCVTRVAVHMDLLEGTALSPMTSCPGWREQGGGRVL